METNTPVLMTEEYWANCQLSIARYFGMINYNGVRYIIVDKHGRDVFECSAIAEKEGRAKAIEPGEPADLCREDFISTYKKLGRDLLIELLNAGMDEREIKQLAKRKKK